MVAIIALVVGVLVCAVVVNTSLWQVSSGMYLIVVCLLTCNLKHIWREQSQYIMVTCG